MYARSYDNEPTAIPPHYNGVAFTDKLPEPADTVKKAPDAPSETVSASGGGILSGLFGADILGKIGLSRIGTEEILLIGAAAFLFFSRDGDKECALLILILLFLG
jgi:hypothetical protein